jgi:hypothetical protein
MSNELSHIWVHIVDFVNSPLHIPTLHGAADFHAVGDAAEFNAWRGAGLVLKRTGGLNVTLDLCDCV